MFKRKVCVVTGTRAEYGLLLPVMKKLKEESCFELQIVVTGMHLSPEFGHTYQVIEEDGFIINEKIEMLLSSDTNIGIAKSMGIATISFADAFERLNPDLIILLGDRFELLAAAQTALVMKIPIAHIAGGDTTEGAYDESIRHSITKMSHIHFVTNEKAKERVLQLGENPDFVFNVGSPGIDNIKQIQLLSKNELENELNFKFREKNLLVTFHPITLDHLSSAEQFNELLYAIEMLDAERFGIIFTKPNADNEGRALIKLLNEFATGKDNVGVYTSLGQQKYLSVINCVDTIVGNSSSGLYEVPSFKKPTVNIGIRQKGRLRADSVIDCFEDRLSIYQAIHKALKMDCSKVENPYGNGDASFKIINHLKKIKDYKKLLQKHFYVFK